MRARVALALGLGLGLAVVALTGCEPDTDNPNRRVYCQVIADAPDRAEASRRMVGTARFWCDRPGADDLTLTVSLQKENSSGAWATVVTKQFAMAGADTVRTDAERYRTRSVAAKCATGTFRTVVTGGSTARGRHVTYEQIGAPQVDPCRKPFLD